MNLKKIWLKITNRKSYFKYKYDQIKESKENLYKNKIKNYLDNVDNLIKSKKEISFLHSGHLGDLVNALPLIKEISKTKKCNYYIESEKEIPKHVQNNLHPFGKVFLSKKSVNMILPLLKRQSYLNSAEEFQK